MGTPDGAVGRDHQIATAGLDGAKGKRLDHAAWREQAHHQQAILIGKPDPARLPRSERAEMSQRQGEGGHGARRGQAANSRAAQGTNPQPITRRHEPIGGTTGSVTENVVIVPFVATRRMT